MEFFVAEFTPNFNKHASIIQFFRSLGVSNAYFMNNVAFGKELARLQDIEKKFSTPVATISVACGPDEPIPTLNDEPTPPPLQQPPMFLDLKPFTLDATAASASECLIPIDVPVSTSERAASDDWPSMCQDLESNVESRSPQPIRGVTTSNTRETKRKVRQYNSQRKDSVALEITCLLCEKTMVNKSKVIAVHAFRHIDTARGHVYSCDGCEVRTNVYKKIATHTREKSHTYTNHSTDPANTELICEIRRVFERCFPGGELALYLVRVIQTMERGGRERRLTGKQACTMCDFVSTMRNAAYLLFHSHTHLDASFGHVFACNECEFTDNKLKPIQDHSSANNHSYTNRATDPRNFEMVMESARLFGVCFPGCTPPLKLDKAVSGANRLRQTEKATPAKSPLPSPAVPPLKRGESTQCQRCETSLQPSNDKVAGVLAHHARAHVEEEGAGKRYGCTGCGEQRVKPSSHFNKSGHVAVDRMRTNAEYASACRLMFEECFPARKWSGMADGEPAQRRRRVSSLDTRFELTCKECSLVLGSESNRVFAHATLHIDQNKYGRRFRCSGCDYTCRKSEGHFNKSTHLIIDRAKDPNEREFVSECARVVSACFPGARLPPTIHAVWENIQYEKEIKEEDMYID